MVLNPISIFNQDNAVGTFSGDDGTAHVTYFNYTNGMVTMAFDTATIPTGFTTSTEKCVAQFLGAEPQFNVWFPMCSTNNVIVPARFEASTGKVFLCNYTGMDLSGYSFYGEVTYARK